MYELVDVHCPDTERIIRVVQDNLSIRSAGALYQASRSSEARRILRSTTPPSTPADLTWSKSRSVSRAASARTEGSTTPTASSATTAQNRWRCIEWMFTTEKAAPKMGRAYPNPAKSHNDCDEVTIRVSSPDRLHRPCPCDDAVPQALAVGAQSSGAEIRYRLCQVDPPPSVMALCDHQLRSSLVAIHAISLIWKNTFTPLYPKCYPRFPASVRPKICHQGGGQCGTGNSRRYSNR
jgi:hypothetical protein